MKISFKKIWQTILNSLNAILHGEFLLRIRIDKYFIHILYSFLLLWLSILLDIRVEKTMVEVEDNKKILNDIKIYHAHKTVEIVSLNRISTVQQMLEEKGSNVTLPEKPASIIKD